MTINFPPSPQDKDYYPLLGQAGPNDLQYQYDLSSNSWNLVAPDNIATTDYVDGLVGDSTRNIRRNYDLHKATNTIPKTITQIENQTPSGPCDNTVYSSLVTELTTVGQNDLPLGVLNDLNDVVANGYSLPEWFECISNDLSTGEFSFVSMNTGTLVRSREFDHTIAFYFTNSDNLNVDQFSVGSTLELKRDLSTPDVNGFSDDAYALYRIIRVEPQYSGSSLIGIGVGVEFLYSYNTSDPYVPDLFRSQGEHTFIVYAKPMDKDGGTFNGSVHIVYDSNETFTISRTDDVSTMVLKVDTTDNNIITNDTYVDLLNAAGDQDNVLNSLATVSYVNQRCGFGTINSADRNGPFLQLSGGTCSGKVIFDHISAPNNFNSFSIIAKPTPNDTSTALRNRRETLYLHTAADGDRIEYTGLGDNDNEIQTKSHVASTLTDKLGGYVSKSGDTLYQNKRIKVASGDNGNFEDRDLVTWGKVKNITVAKVRNGYSGVQPGELYEINGVLYYKSYSS